MALLGSTVRQLAYAADDAWSAELRRVFGRDSGDARYQPRGMGAPGTRLRTLHDAYVAARDIAFPGIVTLQLADPARSESKV